MILRGKYLLWASGAVLLLVAVVVAQSDWRRHEAATDEPAHERPSRDHVKRTPAGLVFSQHVAPATEETDDAAPRVPTSHEPRPHVPSRPGEPERQVAAVATTVPGRVDHGWLGDLLEAVKDKLTGGGGGGGLPAGSDSAEATPVTEADAPPAGAMVKAILFSDRAETACLPGKLEFKLEQTSGVWACVVWSGLAGTYVQQVTFETPDGHVYVAFTSAFATAGKPTGTMLEFEGREYEVKAAGSGADGTALVTATLPVAGTYITQHNLVGQWTVKVALNGEVLKQDTFEFTSAE